MDILFENFEKMKDNAILSIDECEEKAKKLVIEKKLKLWRDRSTKPMDASLGTIYLYHPEGSFIECYSWATVETAYPEFNTRLPGGCISNIHFVVISKLHKPTFTNYEDWYKQTRHNENFVISQGVEMEIKSNNIFHKFIDQALRDGFRIYTSS